MYGVAPSIDLFHVPDAKSHILEKEFENFCARLGISTSIYDSSIKLWRSVYSINSDLQNEAHHWFICMLFISALNSRISERSRLSINTTRILQKSMLTMYNMFSKLKFLRDIVALSDKAIDGILIFERRFCVTSAVYYKFEKIYPFIFLSDEVSELTVDGQIAIPESKHCCWLLFLLVKDHIANAAVELILGFHTLLCCVEYIIKTTPRFLLQPSFEQALDQEKEMVDATGDATPVISVLCEKFGANITEVLQLRKHAENFFGNLATKRVNLGVSELRASYIEILDRYFELDETLFLIRDELVVPPSIASKKDSDTIQLQKTSTVSVGQFLVYLKSLSRSAPIHNYNNDVINDVLTRSSTLFSNRYNVLYPDTDETAIIRFTSAKYLFYATLDRIMSSEKSCNVTEKSLKDLEVNTDFLSSLLACCLIVVLIAHSFQPEVMTSPEEMVDDEYFWIIEALGLTCYNFYKIIPSFLKSVCFATKEIILRLGLIESRILEFHVWKDDSQLFIVTETNEVDVDITDAPPNYTSLYNSPLKASATLPTDNVNSSIIEAKRKSLSLTYFFNKVCRMAYKRLQKICKILGIDADLEQKIWGCLEYCILFRFDIIRKRHLDQILMSSVYAICKVSDTEHKFKSIVSAYRSIPHTSAEVFKQVLINNNEFDSIITFYNKIFMQNLKGFILQFSHNQKMNNSSTKVPEICSPIYSTASRKAIAHKLRTGPGQSSFMISGNANRLGYEEKLSRAEIVKSIISNPNIKSERYERSKPYPVQSDSPDTTTEDESIIDVCDEMPNPSFTSPREKRYSRHLIASPSKRSRHSEPPSSPIPARRSSRVKREPRI